MTEKKATEMIGRGTIDELACGHTIDVTIHVKLSAAGKDKTHYAWTFDFEGPGKGTCGLCRDAAQYWAEEYVHATTERVGGKWSNETPVKWKDRPTR
jgi:hypothetical protein